MKGLKTVILFLILISVFWVLFIPGPKGANDFPYTFSESVKAGFSLPQVWSSRGDGFGQYVVSTLWAWPVDVLYGLGATLNIDFSILERVIGIFPAILVGLFGINKFLEFYEIKGWGRFVGILVYLLNTYFLLLIDGGQLVIALSYAFLPIAFLLFEKSIAGKLKDRLIAAISISLLGFFDIRFIYVLGILLLLRFLYELFFISKGKWWNWFLSWLKTSALTGIVLIGLNMYWLLPSLLAKAPILPVTYTRVSQTSFLSFANIGHSMLLLAPHWYKNVFGKITPLLASFIFLPILAFLAPILRKKDKNIGFWLLVAVFSIFLVKGANPPFANIYEWLFIHVPGFSLFRDPTKFFVLISISYSFLIGTTLYQIGKKFKLLPILVAAYLVLLVSPVYMGKMTGLFSKPINEKEYFKMANIFASDKTFGRILWMPSRPPLGFASLNHPAVDVLRLLDKRPFASSVTGSYELLNYLRKPYIGQLLDIAGVGYVSYPFPDTRREELKPDNIDYYNWFLGKINASPWATPIIAEPPVPLIKINKHQDRFFIPQNIYFVIGSDRIYQDIFNINGKLASNALVFVEETPNLIKRINEFSNSKVILYGKNEEDLTASFLDGKEFIFPAKNLDFSPNETGWPASNALRSNAGWWKRETVDLISWRAFLQEKYGIDNQDFDYGGGYAIAEGNRELQITNDKFQTGKILIARVMEGIKGGKVEFYQGDKLIGTINTLTKNSTETNFHWFEIGNLKSDGEITIRTFGQINVVNALAAVNVQDWNTANHQADSYINRGQVFYWDRLTKNQKLALFNPVGSPKVTYERIASTHYKVKVEGLKNSAVLAFSESYDSLWTANNKSSVPLYSLINGFSIDRDGEYDVYFTPQKYVVPGLYISGITLTILVLALIILK